MYKEFLDSKRRLIISISLLLSFFFLLLIFKEKTIQVLNQNKEALKAFSSMIQIEKLRNLDFFIKTQWYGKNFGQFLPLIALIFSYSVFSKEFEKKTFDFLITRKSRKNIFIKKVSSIYINFVLINIIFFIISIITLSMSSFDFQIIDYFKIFIQQTIISSLIIPIAVLISIITQTQIKSFIIPLTIIFLCLTLYFLPNVKIKTPYNFILDPKLIIKNEMDFLPIILSILFSIFLIFFSLKIFEKKDF
ncbi:ABC transporter permease subunit [Oceanotoga sp. DSM 15011]|uniref:ABC-2 family transporter n=1 Tax=Oceanotoga teriensis TaxID=515440 RepID=A0AA45C5M8_9BACT|nr:MULTISPECIES: ABC transporter permease subunit [Oceanotoga]PWJ89322.1 ABC-2 family transporter [Oceanotoga teriensis]UYO98820.1 ABC transporter permease subunit [Oceanotoga sp. DSM 15011]